MTRLIRLLAFVVLAGAWWAAIANIQTVVLGVGALVVGVGLLVAAVFAVALVTADPKPRRRRPRAGRPADLTVSRRTVERMRAREEAGRR